MDNKKKIRALENRLKEVEHLTDILLEENNAARDYSQYLLWRIEQLQKRLDVK